MGLIKQCRFGATKTKPLRRPELVQVSGRVWLRSVTLFYLPSGDIGCGQSWGLCSIGYRACNERSSIEDSSNPLLYCCAKKSASQQYKRQSTATPNSRWLPAPAPTHLVKAATDIRFIQKLLAHAGTKTTEIYTPIITKPVGMDYKPIGLFGYIRIRCIFRAHCRTWVCK